MSMLRSPLGAPVRPLARKVTEAGGGGPFSVTGAYTAVIGDSIDAFGATSWFSECCRLTGQRMRHYLNKGVGGNTTAQMLGRINADIISQSPPPHVCVIGGCTNDHSQGVAAATTQQNYRDMVAALRSAGIRPMIRNTPSNNNAGTGAYNTVALRRQAVLDHNAWLESYCAAEGVALIDIFTPTHDGTGLAAIYTGDGTHLNSAGCYAAARYAAARMPAFINGAARPHLASLGDTRNLIGNGLFIGDTNGDGYANGWGGYGSITAKSLVSNAVDGIGNAQRIDYGATLGVFEATPRVTAGFSAGDVLEVAMVLSVTGGRITARAKCFDSAGAQVGSAIDLAYNWEAQSSDAQTLFGRLTVPALTTAVALEVTPNGTAGYLQAMRAAIRNRTANP